MLSALSSFPTLVTYVSSLTSHTPPDSSDLHTLAYLEEFEFKPSKSPSSMDYAQMTERN